MKITLLGSGTPTLDPACRQAALLVETGGSYLLFDAGSGVSYQMALAGLHPARVTDVFITHHHYDHISGLGDFLLTAWYGGRETPLPVYGPPGTAAIVAALLDQVFGRDIAFTRVLAPEMPDIRHLVQVTEIDSGWAGSGAGWQVQTAAVEHGHALGLTQADWPCLGYRLEAGGKSIAISGDTVACAGLDRLACNAGALVMCAYLAAAELTSPAAEHQAKYVIASSAQAGEIAARNRVKKLILTHIRPKSATLMETMLAEVRKEYTGEVIVGQDLLVIEI